MKIRFTQSFSNGRESFQVGKAYDLSNDDALRYINAGIANKATEPVEPDKPQVVAPPPLKPGEKAGVHAETHLPEADPVSDPAPDNTNNPAAFLHPDGTVEPHTGFTTSEPDANVSPPSDGKSPLASHEAPNAKGSPVPAKSKTAKSEKRKK